MNSLFSFYLCMHHPDQDIRHLCHSRKLPAPLASAILTSKTASTLTFIIIDYLYLPLTSHVWNHTGMHILARCYSSERSFLRLSHVSVFIHPSFLGCIAVVHFINTSHYNLLLHSPSLDTCTLSSLGLTKASKNI